MKPMRPMEAVAALYADDHGETAQAIVASLSRVVFGAHELAPAGASRRLLARLSYRLLRRTTRRTIEGGETIYRNSILERSGHPYADALVSSSHRDVAGLVEGGDPMNGPYLMLVPEIRQAGDRWDRIFFNSVMGRDVQLRFIWETLATYREASERLRAGRPVRLLAVAAGTGLSLLLVYDRLLADGHDPATITAAITDREPVNTEKTRRLLAKLPVTRNLLTVASTPGKIAVFSADVFSPAEDALPPHDVVTAVGIFEYLQGQTCDTTERRLGLPEPREQADAPGLATRLAAIAAADASLVVNTYRPHPSIRILENFGKKFDFRTRENLATLLAQRSFEPAQLLGSGTIYDVEVYKKRGT